MTSFHSSGFESPKSSRSMHNNSSRVPMMPSSTSQTRPNTTGGFFLQPINRPPSAGGLSFKSGGDESFRANGSKQKFAELGSRMTDIDTDLENQNHVRKQRDMRLDSLQNDFSVQQKMLRIVEERVLGLEEFGQRMDRGLSNERDMRETLEKTSVKLMDDRQKALLQRVEQEKFERENELDTTRKRVLNVEDNMATLMNLLEDDHKCMRGIERTITKIHERLDVLQTTVEAEQTKRMEEGSNSVKALNNTVVSLQQMVMTEAHVRDKEMEKLRGGFGRECDELKREMDLRIKDSEHRVDRLLQPLEQEVKQMGSEFAQAKADRELSAATGNARINAAVADMKRQLEADMAAREAEGATKFKSVEDRLWKLSYTIDKEKEGREKQVKSLTETLDDEKRAREESEETLARLLDQTIERFRAGLEAVERKVAMAENY